MRVAHEQLALRRFQDIADRAGLVAFRGQNAHNRVRIGGAVYYQFGDLRVELPSHTVVVEVESSGGITNLAKYWECLASARVKKPIKLLHLFQQKSAADYESHMIVWRFLLERMSDELADRFEARLHTYQAAEPSTLDDACERFARWVTP